MNTGKKAMRVSVYLLRYVVLCSLTVMILSACGPLYTTEYLLEAPETQQGQLCIMQCKQNRDQCKNDLKSALKDCRHRNEIAALKLKNCLKAGEMTCYDSRTPCPPLDFEQCNKEHRYCYQSCGGKVVPQITCMDSWGWGLGCN